MLSLTRWSFSHIFIPLFLWTTRAGGEGGYEIWERLGSRLAKVVGKFARLRQREWQQPIEGMMQIVDWADDLIGAEGEWEKIGSTRAVKRIASCPHAERLKASPAFCTKLGVTMGREAFRAYYHEAKVCYAIPQTKSQGASYCEYMLIVFSRKSARDESGPTYS